LLGNPRAIAKNVRYTEENLNRMFKIDIEDYSEKEKSSYEYHRAQFLKTFFDEADALLDIHSTKNASQPFVFAERNADHLTDFFPKEIVRIVYGIDAIEPGGTDGYMYRHNKIGICIECGQHESKDANFIAQESIMSFLASRGHLDRTVLVPTKREVVQMNEMYYTKTDSFTLSKIFTDFEQLKNGDLIGLDGQEEIRAEKDYSIVFAHDAHKKGTEGFLLGYII
jgi:succinylglutamate desuccinylase